MKSFKKHLSIKSDNKIDIINITSKIDAYILESEISDGIALINTMDLTSSIFISDDEIGLHQDFKKWLDKLTSHDPAQQYQHNVTGEDNADAHMKRQIMGREVVIAITDGKPDFGPWEQIFYAEFDGLRPKKVLVKIIGE